MVTITVGVTPVTMGTGKDSVLSSITLHIVKPCLCEKGGGEGREREGRTERGGEGEGDLRFQKYCTTFRPIYSELWMRLVHNMIILLHSKDSIPFPLLTGPIPSPNVE